MVKPQVVKRPIVEVIGGYHAAADTLAHQDYILDQDEINSGNPSKKRRRLTYLSPEERLLRRKLKNRVAAQIARDKKKAKMSELEEMIAKLEEQNRKLQSENYNLKKEVKAANEEKEQLKCQMGGTITRRSNSSLIHDDHDSQPDLLQQLIDQIEIIPDEDVGARKTAELDHKYSKIRSEPSVSATQVEDLTLEESLQELQKIGLKLLQDDDNVTSVPSPQSIGSNDLSSDDSGFLSDQFLDSNFTDVDSYLPELFPVLS
ncbi:DgyrCDS2662 [Dimorphilus gyrociliatus]|uniref:X-box-binding protein 1 n=1 Tax=Dimorphilus gyrociliatus TaxID=2664684 RepID=A0A7I8VDR0_9ANNE|nr:DgyrCDS2662 [Dimorphilus gyrociliatus]